MLLVFQARCARNYLEIPEKEHFLTIDQLNRRSHFADIRQLFVEFKAHFFSRLAVQEEHDLPTAVYKGAIILIFAQENELLKVAVYLWKALPNFIDRFLLVCGLLDYGVLVDGPRQVTHVHHRGAGWEGAGGRWRGGATASACGLGLAPILGGLEDQPRVLPVVVVVVVGGSIRRLLCFFLLFGLLFLFLFFFS